MLEALPENHGTIVAVGDVTVKGLMDMGFLPDIAFVDGQTKREGLGCVFACPSRRVRSA